MQNVLDFVIIQDGRRNIRGFFRKLVQMTVEFEYSAYESPELHVLRFSEEPAKVVLLTC